MAQRPKQRIVTTDDQWSCALSAIPDQVRGNDMVTLTVTLSNSKFDLLSEADKEKVYATGFTYRYDSENEALRNAINSASESPGRQVSFQVPDLSSGDHDISVKVVPEGEWKVKVTPSTI